ncbi:MAG: hypothetical protein U0X20_00025 [Caldilineaceae bacterium]
MTISAAFPTPLPQGASNGASYGPGEQPGAESEAQAGPQTMRPADCPATQVVPVNALTIHEVYACFIEHRAAVHASLAEQRAAGVPVNVPDDAVFMCELAGLVVDLETGLIDGLAGDLVAPIPALRSRLANAGFVVDGQVVIVGSAATPS